MQEECGVFGIYDPKEDISTDIYYALVALQHRGQEGAGIAVNNNREITYHKNLGLVNDIFNEKNLLGLKGKMGVGHVRYAPSAANLVENVQPLVLRYVKGSLAIAHNGSLVNTNKLKEELEVDGAIFQTTTDTELLAYTIARNRLPAGSIEEATKLSLEKIQGAYSLIIMSPKKLVIARDPFGFRPLAMGRKGDKIMFASESCAFDVLDAEYERDVLPGEIIVVENGEMRIHKEGSIKNKRVCSFEYIYFARPDSVIDNQLINDARKNAGILLAKEHAIEADIVIGVPDSGIGAAIGYSIESKIPYETGFIKNRYIGRTFIKSDQKDRELSVRLKLNTLKSSIEGKRVIMVDDSIVRGTTAGRIVKLLKNAGAKEVHVRVSSPPFKNQCYFGTDIPDKESLAINNRTIEDLRIEIGADSLGFLSADSIKKLAPKSAPGFCDACFTGDYPIKNIEDARVLSS